MPGGFGNMMNQGYCPCGGLSYVLSCRLLHQGERWASSGKMDDGFPLFSLCHRRGGYLLATDSKPDVPAQQRRRALEWSCRQSRWLGLTVPAVSGGGPVIWREQCNLRRATAVGAEGDLSGGRKGDCLAGAWLDIQSLESTANAGMPSGA